MYLLEPSPRLQPSLNQIKKRETFTGGATKIATQVWAFQSPPYYTFSRTCQIEPNSKNKKHIGSTDFSQSCPKLKENHHCQRAANVHPKSITRIKELLWLCQVQKGQSIEFNDKNLLAMLSLKGQPIWEKLLLAEPPNGQSVWIEVGLPNCNRPPEEEKTDHLTTSRVCWIEMKRCWALQGQPRRCIDVLGLNRQGTE